jgi:hypothetical protein
VKLTKLTALLTVIYVLVLTTTTAIRSGSAEEPKKPAAAAKNSTADKLTELDFTRLKLAVTTKELAQQQAQRAVDQANATIAASDAEIERICKDYKIDCAQLSHSVNAKGEIIRQPELLAPKPDKPAKAAKK